MKPRRLRYRVVPGAYAVCRLSPKASVPAWAHGEHFCSVTRTAEELSVICPVSRVPADVKAQRGWRGLQIVGPLPFDAVGVLVQFARPLADEGIPILAVATHDTDYVLIPEGSLREAERALGAAGHGRVD